MTDGGAAAGWRGWAAHQAAASRRRLQVTASMLLAACGAKSAEPSAPLTPHPQAGRLIHTALLVRAPHPGVAFPDLVPDLAEEPRWPLTGMQHPSLQPSFDVADALAEPGITWTELCERNVDRRRDAAHRDELVYLAGWCAAERRDTATAVDLLGQVRLSAVPGIAHAVPFDIANVLVDSQDADHADQILMHAHVRDVHLYDLLAAANFEIGRYEDALQATTSALQLDTSHDVTATCHRLARSVLLGPRASRSMLMLELTDASRRVPSDATCSELSVEVSCIADPEVGCQAYRLMHSIDPMLFDLARIDQHWSDARAWYDWLDVARDIRMDLLRPQADAMWNAAIDAAVVGSECDQTSLAAIDNTISGWWRAPGFESVRAKAGWVGALLVHPSECVRFREQWLRSNPQ